MKRKLILASASQRRKELMELIGVPFEVIPASSEDPIDTSIPLHEAIQKVSLAKAKDVYKDHEDALVLGSDTIVVYQDQILGKPKDAEDAKRMLHLLSGSTHKVLTGYAFISKEETFTGYEETEVIFAPLSDEEIDTYVATGEPMDKAGAYAIQGISGVFVKEVHGDVYTVIGLPLHRVYTYLKEHGYLERGTNV